MKKFKYKVITIPVDSLNTAVDELNNDGFNGWELVSVQCKNAGALDVYVYFLKKEV